MKIQILILGFRGLTRCKTHSWTVCKLWLILSTETLLKISPKVKCFVEYKLIVLFK